METKEYDVVVIGSGPGGYVAAIRAAQLGLKTACIEKEKTLGGTCLNVGCIPSKALLHATEVYAAIQSDTKELGIQCSKVTMDFDQLMKRKEKVVQGLTEGIAGLFKKNKIDSIFGVAKFVAPNKIEVFKEGHIQEISAKQFILATGSEPISLPFLPFDEKIVLSSTGALSLQSIPKKMIVIGGGVIGVELASVYRRLGTEIIVIEMLDRICPAMDESVCKNLLQILKKQGIEFHLESKVVQAKRDKNGITLTVENGGKPQEFSADTCLVAVGRRPFSKGLELQNIGVKIQNGLVQVDGNFQTSIPHIYAIGDLIEGPMLAHRASEEGCVVAELIAGKKAQLNYLAIPNVIYTHPEVAAVGLTEKEARELGGEVFVGTASFRGNPRARCNNDVEGFVKVIGMGKEGNIVGLHMIGPQVSELINIGVVAIEKRTTLQEMANFPLAHPTLSEILKEACGNAIGHAIHG